jgi:Tfp pilus assembly protein PilV
MKLLIGKIKQLKFQKKGETLMEAIVSVLLLSILLVTVTAMIQTSRNVTARSMQDAIALQEGRLNPVASASENIDPDDLDEVSITFTVPSMPLLFINATHNILLYDNDNIVAFFPDVD